MDLNELDNKTLIKLKFKLSKTDIEYLRSFIKIRSHPPLLLFACVTLALSYTFYVYNMVWFVAFFFYLCVAIITKILMYKPFNFIFAAIYALCSSSWFIVSLEVSKSYKINGALDVGSDITMGVGIGLLIFTIIATRYHNED